MKIRGANQMGVVPSNYRCYKCHQTGHWIKDCPLGQGPVRPIIITIKLFFHTFRCLGTD